MMVFVDFPNEGGHGDVSTQTVADHILGGGKTNEFLRQQSYGTFNHKVTILNGWKRMTKSSYEYTDANKSFGTSELHETYIKEAVEKYPDVNLNDYKAVYVVAYKDPGIFNSSTFNGIKPNWCVNATNGTVCKSITFGVDAYKQRWKLLTHELGHILGLPDLYPYSKIDHVVKHWALMGDNWNAANYIGWHRHKLGWLSSKRKQCTLLVKKNTSCKV
ncbi:MAG: hypothetical protein IPK76_07075 [Lewinellaceae bacterium]|nr:hypothetical protein [Lewinellaceae bacterium]